MRLAALGFKLHTGWAAVVAVIDAPREIEVVLRRRIELLPSDDAVPRFVYHKAAELPAKQAADLVTRVTTACRETAQEAVQALVQELRSQKISPCAAGIPTSSTVLPEDLGAILASHPFIHTAEGVLFQRVAAGACEAVGLPVRRARERDLRAKMAGEAGRALDALRKSLGPPWGADQKAATAAALWALGRI